MKYLAFVIGIGQLIEKGVYACVPARRAGFRRDDQFWILYQCGCCDCVFLRYLDCDIGRGKHGGVIGGIPKAIVQGVKPVEGRTPFCANSSSMRAMAAPLSVGPQRV